MTIQCINPFNPQPLTLKQDYLCETQDNRFPKNQGVYCFGKDLNDIETSDLQWNKLQTRQIDRPSKQAQNKNRFLQDINAKIVRFGQSNQGAIVKGRKPKLSLNN